MDEQLWLERLHRMGVEATTLSRGELALRDLRWLELYCPHVKEQTGESIYGGYRWHAYSFEFETALQRDRAWEAYRARRETQYIIVLEHQSIGFQCRGPAHPDLSDTGDDLYVQAIDYSWTMAFTHEATLGLGPYFAVPAKRT